VVREGAPVIDLWGGIADEVSGARWERDKLQVIFSRTKALVVCVF
jgi:hypothetical protein